MENPVIIFGASGLGKAALEIFESNEVPVFCFLDDDASLHNTEIKEVAVLGSTDDDGFLKHIGKDCEAFVAEDENKVRKSLVEMLIEDRKVMPVNAIHNSVVLSSNASIGHGNLFNAGVRIGSFTRIGSHCIFNSAAIVDHEAQLGDFVQVGAGSIINSGVHIEDEVFIGSGVTVVSGIKIGKGARIGAGSVVISDVSANQTFFGNPAKSVD
jgi:sugar O-acyltransferase (sialic acid O-acetyltransferase NeuD family)